MKKEFQLSRWCHFFPLGETMAIYHALSMFVVYLEKNKGDQLYSLKGKTANKKLLLAIVNSEELDILLQNNIFIDNFDQDLHQLVDLREALLKDTKLDLMYLLLTDSCNMKCRYCFEDSPKKPDNFCETMMSEKTAKESIDFFARVTKKYGREGSKKVIHLYGGEPLLNPKALKAAVLRVEELKSNGGLPENSEIIIITNGLLLTDELANFLSVHDVSMGLSIDGPKSINNIHRLAKNINVDVFAESFKAYNLAIDYGITVGLSATLTPEVINDFPKVLDYFINDLKIKDGLSFNILHFNPSVPVDEDYFQKAADCLIKAFESFRQLNIYEERMMRKVKAFVSQEAMLADCGIVGNQIVIAPDGQVGVCQDFVKPRTYFGGSIYDKNYDPVLSGLFSEWRKRSPLFMEECFNCEAIAVCGGGCPASVELKTGNRWNIDKRICPHSKKTLAWLILESFKDIIPESL
jgi:uncharacterized protein